MDKVTVPEQNTIDDQNATNDKEPTISLEMNSIADI